MSRKHQSQHKEEKPILDIIIVTGGRFDMLRRCLKALEAQENSPKFAVYVVDNATENHERLHNKDIFEMPIITRSKRLTQELGFPAANNDGVNMGTSPLILFLNDDVELRPDAIRLMVNKMDDEEIGAVGLKLVFPNDVSSKIRPAGKTQHVGIAMNINGDVIHPLVGWSADNPKCCVSREIFAVTGACMMTRRALFRKIGGFYVGYGLGTFEEIDLQMSLKTMGKKIWLVAETFGTHYTGATAEKKQRPYPLQQNNMIFRARWQSSGLFLWDDFKMW